MKTRAYARLFAVPLLLCAGTTFAGDPDPCDTVLPVQYYEGDVNGDFVVDSDDLAIITAASAIGLSGDITVNDGDINRDGKVDSSDIAKYYAILDTASSVAYPSEKELYSATLTVDAISGSGELSANWEPRTGGRGYYCSTYPDTSCNDDPIYVKYELDYLIYDSSTDLSAARVLTGERNSSGGNQGNGGDKDYAQIIWKPDPNGTSLAPTISIESAPNGFDIVAEYSASPLLTSPRRLGAIEIYRVLEVMSHGNDDYVFHDFIKGGATGNTTGALSNYHFYPGGTSASYVPSNALTTHLDGPSYPDSKYSLVVTALYPVVEYNHPVSVRLERACTAIDRCSINAKIRFNWSETPASNGIYNSDADIQPGEDRTYRIQVRYIPWAHEDLCPDEANWLYGLESYRREFRRLYGPVQYTRDRRPMINTIMAQGEHYDTDNPYGFATSIRPDRYGFQPLVDRLEDQSDDGWERLNIRVPTGLYPENTLPNFPFQFTSQWSFMDQLDFSTTPPTVISPPNIVQNTLYLLPDYVDKEGVELNLWWGRSDQFPSDYYSSNNGWGTGSMLPFDRTDSNHTGAAFTELDGAEYVKATGIGLDAFSVAGGSDSLTPRDGYFWLMKMKSEYPDMKFTIEPQTVDFMHTLGPNWLNMTNSYNASKPIFNWAEGAYSYTLPAGFILADFLNPGQESRAMLQGAFLASGGTDWYDNMTSLPPGVSDETGFVVYMMEELASKGFVIEYFESPHATLTAPISTSYDFDADPDANDHLLPAGLPR